MSARRLFTAAAAAISLAAILSGCATVDVSRVGVTMVDAEISGWYLFNCIPLASGNPAKPNAFSCRPFKADVTLENNMKLLEWAMRKEDAAAISDVVSYETDEQVGIILLQRHTVHTSARLTRKLHRSGAAKVEDIKTGPEAGESVKEEKTK